MDNRARYGFPRFVLIFAGLALFAGCKSEPARVDALAISKLRPGHERIEELKVLLGPPGFQGGEVHEPPCKSPKPVPPEVWWGSHRDFWRLEFDSDGRLYRTPWHVRY